MVILAYAPLDALSNFDNFMADDGTYTVRTKYEDFIKLVDGEIRPSDSLPPNEGILLVRRLDQTWDPEWTPVCYYNFNDENQACLDLGFPNGAIGFHDTNVEAVNGGEWEVRDGWRRNFEYGKYPYSEINNVENNFYSEKPRRKIFISVSNETQSLTQYNRIFMTKTFNENPRSILTYTHDVSNVRKCNEYKPIVWLVCDNSLTNDPRTITEIGLEPTG